MYKQDLREQFQRNPEAFDMFKLLLGLEKCNPDFLIQDEESARAGQVFQDDIWPDEVDVDTAAATALATIPTQSSEMKKIREKYSNLMKSVAAPYSKEEQATWFKQEKAAEEYAKDGTITPFIQKMADARGIEVLDLITKIQENIDLYNDTIFELLGKQQKELDEL